MSHLSKLFTASLAVPTLRSPVSASPTLPQVNPTQSSFSMYASPPQPTPSPKQTPRTPRPPPPPVQEQQLAAASSLARKYYQTETALTSPPIAPEKPLTERTPAFSRRGVNTQSLIVTSQSLMGQGFVSTAVQTEMGVDGAILFPHAGSRIQFVENATLLREKEHAATVHRAAIDQWRQKLADAEGSAQREKERFKLLIEESEDKSRRVAQELEQTKETVSEKNIELKALRKRTNEIASKYESLQVELQETQARLRRHLAAEHETRADSLLDKVLSVEDEKNRLVKRVEALNLQLTHCNEVIDAQRKSIDEHREVETLLFDSRKQIDDLKAKLEASKKDMATLIAAHAKEMKGKVYDPSEKERKLEAQLTDAIADARSSSDEAIMLRKRVKELEVTERIAADAKRERQSALAQQRGVLEEEVARERAAHDQTVAEIKRQYEVLVSRLQQSLVKEQQTLEQTENRASDLAQQLDDSQKKITDLQTENKIIASRNTYLQSEIETQSSLYHDSERAALSEVFSTTRDVLNRDAVIETLHHTIATQETRAAVFQDRIRGTVEELELTKQALVDSEERNQTLGRSLRERDLDLINFSSEMKRLRDENTAERIRLENENTQLRSRNGQLERELQWNRKQLEDSEAKHKEAHRETVLRHKSSVNVLSTDLTRTTSSLQRRLDERIKRCKLLHHVLVALAKATHVSHTVQGHFNIAVALREAMEGAEVPEEMTPLTLIDSLYPAVEHSSACVTCAHVKELVMQAVAQTLPSLPAWAFGKSTSPVMRVKYSVASMDPVNKSL